MHFLLRRNIGICVHGSGINYRTRRTGGVDMQWWCNVVIFFLFLKLQNVSSLLKQPNGALRWWRHMSVRLCLQTCYVRDRTGEIHPFLTKTYIVKSQAWYIIGESAHQSGIQNLPWWRSWGIRSVCCSQWKDQQTTVFCIYAGAYKPPLSKNKANDSAAIWKDDWLCIVAQKNWENWVIDPTEIQKTPFIILLACMVPCRRNSNLMWNVHRAWSAQVLLTICQNWRIWKINLLGNLQKFFLILRAINGGLQSCSCFVDCTSGFRWLCCMKNIKKWYSNLRQRGCWPPATAHASRGNAGSCWRKQIPRDSGFLWVCGS